MKKTHRRFSRHVVLGFITIMIVIMIIIIIKIIIHYLYIELNLPAAKRTQSPGTTSEASITFTIPSRLTVAFGFNEVFKAATASY